MPLLERGYRTAARADLDNGVNKLEEQAKAAQEKEEFERSMTELQNNMNFAVRLNLINEAQLHAYRERIAKAQHIHAQAQNAALRPVEVSRAQRIARQSSMDSYRAQIAQKRAEAKEGKAGGEASRDLECEEIEQQH